MRLGGEPHSIYRRHREKLEREDPSMRTVRGEWRCLPSPVEKAVLDVGRQLHREVLGDDVFLLALTRLDAGSAARQVLEAEGVTADVVLANIRTGGDGERPEKLGMTFAPPYYAMHARADAFAASLGDGTITPEHVLLALLWDGQSSSSHILWRLGVRREDLVEGPRARGVPVPVAPVPGQREIDLGEPVWFDRDQVRAVIERLKELPAGTQWGFNYEGDRAFAIAESSVDLEALVAEVLPPAIELRRLDHVQLAMPAGHEDEATAFYEGLLGLPRVPKPERLAGRGGCWFGRGELRIHLGVDPDFRPARKAHPALLVRGLAALTERLRCAGVPVTEDPAVDGTVSVYVDDPFGNRVELLERGGTLPGPP